MAQLQPKEGWEFLLLDLGDCLETFRLYCPGSQEVMAEPKLRTLLSPFSDVKYCKQVLRGRDKLYLLSGFESLFTLLATVTTAGLVYEDV